MNAAVYFFVLMTLFFSGMAQSKSMDAHTAYAIAGTSGAIAMVLAVIRYKGRKDAGE
jgi:multidrug transporter EmrE-like cation transporter